MKKRITILLSILLCVGCGTTQSSLPRPEKEEGLRGEQFGIDKNINEKTIDQYLNRSDAVYRDVRMLKDEANYEAIGGDSWLSGIVEGFEVVPYPYIVNVEGLPEEVGTSYQGNTLFYHDENGYTENYKESMDILEYYFPKDKVIFLMCGGGGYAGMMKNMLVDLGWNPDKIYNVGGYWFYEGKHAQVIKREVNGETYYDFYKLNYHPIEFDSLHSLHENPTPTPSSSSTSKDTGLITIDVPTLEEMIAKKETFAVSVFLPGCSSCAMFKPIVEEVEASKQIEIVELSLAEAKEKNTIIGQYVSYTPSLVIFKEGELVAYLNANSYDDYPYYSSAEKLSERMSQYVNIKVVKGESSLELDECEDSCKVFD